MLFDPPTITDCCEVDLLLFPKIVTSCPSFSQLLFPINIASAALGSNYKEDGRDSIPLPASIKSPEA